MCLSSLCSKVMSLELCIVHVMFERFCVISLNVDSYDCLFELYCDVVFHMIKARMLDVHEKRENGTHFLMFWCILVLLGPI